MNLDQEINRYNTVAKYFCDNKKFKQKGIRYKWNPKIAIHVFNNEIKTAISEGAGLKKLVPDFSIVKNPDIESNIGGQIINFTDETQFSLWRILNEKEGLKKEQRMWSQLIFPFHPVRKHNRIIRTPEYKVVPLNYWEIVSPLLVR